MGMGRHKPPQNQKALQAGTLLPPRSLNPVSLFSLVSPVEMWESLPAMTKQEIRAGQKGDPVVGPVLHFKS